MSTTGTYTKSGAGSRTQELKPRGAVQEKPFVKPERQRQHEWLQKLVGEWTFEGEVTMEPGKGPEKFTGVETVRPLGDYWILIDCQSQMPGGQETMAIALGYDPQTRRFVGGYIASMMPHFWVYEGSLDAAEKVLTLNTEGPNMLAEGKIVRFKDVMEIRNDNERVLTSQVLGDDGKWQKVVTIHYRRTE
jgi:hypothetical protein